jgi:hypothetical protein
VSGGKFRLDSRDSLAMEMPDGSFQRTVTAKSAFLTITLVSRGSALTADIALDSMMLDRPNAMVQPLVDSAIGTRWQGTVRSTGELDSLSANKISVLGEQVRAMVSRLLPTLPDSGVKPGDRWETRGRLPYQVMAGFSANEERAAEFQAGKWEDRNGTRALNIESAVSYTVTGSGSGFGQEIQVSGSGRAQGSHRVSAGGLLLTAQVSDSVSLTLTVPAVGQSVPTTVITSYSIRMLP